MEREKLHSILMEKMSECWNAYIDSLLPLPPIQIIGKAAEIAAARTCYDELTENAAAYSENLLARLLQYDGPLEILREQWMDEQCGDVSIAMEHALRSLRDRGPRPDERLSVSSMSLKRRRTL